MSFITIVERYDDFSANSNDLSAKVCPLSLARLR